MRRNSTIVIVSGTAVALASLLATPLAFTSQDPPPIVHLTGVVRDFREWGIEGGHPDFEQMPDTGFGRYAGNVAGSLGEQSKPLFTGEGFKIAQQWRDAEARAICPCIYDAGLGDVEGASSQPGTGGVTSGESFNQWFNDAHEVNLSTTKTLELLLQEDGTYLFDSEIHSPYVELGGFFPIDDQLYGNSTGSDHNYHFTFELHTQFEYHADEQPFFKFDGDDTVFVFINDELVIDLGGVHAAHDQYLDVTRLNLEQGQVYPLDLFFAQRHRPQSNFRIWTNLLLETTGLPTISGLHD